MQESHAVSPAPPLGLPDGTAWMNCDVVEACFAAEKLKSLQGMDRNLRIERIMLHRSYLKADGNMLCLHGEVLMSVCLDAVSLNQEKWIYKQPSCRDRHHRYATKEN
jgi:hypothetical protein